MKKSIFALVITGMVILAAKSSLAQTTTANLLVNALITADAPAAAVEAINQRAVSNFKKKYAAGADANWMVLKDGYVASFTKDGIKHKVYYHTNGNFAGTIKGYEGCKLSQQTAGLVSELYPGYNISYVNEVKVDGNDNTATYVVNLKGANDELKVVKICDGETELVFDSATNERDPKRF
ncbi:MAG: hypothetical protein QM791_10360 [Ferruginibacter sp.]